MPNKPFGLAEPQYDALRVLSTQALQAGPGDGTSEAGGGLENKIYLWQPDGSSLIAYAPDAAGLALALAAAYDGGTIVLPSMQIDLTDGITLPVGVTLIGLSRDETVLSFTTLNNESAITHSARATLEHLTVIVAGTQPLVGVDARAAKARVRHVVVQMASHANNVKIYAGYAEA